MASYNKVILLGNLTRDPQLSYTPSQTAVVDFGLAINRKWSSQDGQKREEVCFVDCTAFGRSAENINKYCQKGRPLLVEGRLTFDSWQAQDGSKRSKLKVTVESFQFIGSTGQGGDQGQGSGQGGYQQPAQQQQQQQQQQNNNYSQESGPSPAGPEAVGNDDIPF